jgi:hypothetical protein
MMDTAKSMGVFSLMLPRFHGSFEHITVILGLLEI